MTRTCTSSNGQEYDIIGLEEATLFSKFQMDFIRTCNRTVRKDIKPRMYFTCNPGRSGSCRNKKTFYR